MDSKDPNANLFGYDEEEKSEEERAFEQMYEKNPIRVDALGDLIYEEISSLIDSQEGLDDEAKRQMLFKMTANSVLDMVMDAADTDIGIEMSFSFDMLIGVALTNRKYNVDLFKEHEKALTDVKPSKFNSEEEYQMALQDFEESWWDLPQPLLEKRSPNDAIREVLGQYGLSD